MLHGGAVLSIPDFAVFFGYQLGFLCLGISSSVHSCIRIGRTWHISIGRFTIAAGNPITCDRFWTESTMSCLF